MGILVHVERLDAGFRLTAEVPCGSTMQVALNALLAINTDAFAYRPPSSNELRAVMEEPRFAMPVSQDED